MELPQSGGKSASPRQERSRCRAPANGQAISH
jgi:hypothetical protein